MDDRDDPPAPPAAEGAEARFRRLRAMGLTEYQAKAYLALLRLGRGTAAQVARVTDVPRNKLYPVMQQLNQAGLVETALGEAQVFRPLPLDRFVGERLRGLRAEADRLEADRAALAALFRADPAGEAPTAPYRLYHGRAHAVEQLRLALRGARSRVDLVASAGSPGRMLASGEAEALREALDEGAAARVVLPAKAAGHPALPDLAALLGDAVRLADAALPACVLLAVDGRVCVQVQLQPDDASPSRGGDVTLVSASPVLAQVGARFAGLLWESPAGQAAPAPPGGAARAPAPQPPSRGPP